MIEPTKLAMLIGLLRRGAIRLADIKDEEYRAAAEAALAQNT